MNTSDRRAYEMCRLALVHLTADPDGVTAKALANIMVWERQGTCHPWYVERWRHLLAHPVGVGAVLMAENDEGQMLRANNPFAGVLTPAERAMIRAVGAGSVGRAA